MLKPKRRKKCPICRGWYMPWSTLQKACGPICAIDLTVEQKAKLARVENKAAKNKLKTISQRLNEAQVECNKFTRLRDDGDGCISCGKRDLKKVNAGHYMTVKSRSELRFHPFNVNLQCEPCNTHLSGNPIKYRQGLIKKIGAEAVEWLENHHDYYRFTPEDAQEIKEFYRAEYKRLKKERGNGY